MIPIYKPFLENYKTSAKDAIDSSWISNHGIYVDLASNLLCKILGVKYCILMNNGTSATHCLYKSLKFKYPSIKKIYIPNNVFIAPWNCGVQEFDKDIFEVMKMDKDTLNICVDEDYILSLDKNSAIMIVHNLGNIINVPRLQRLRPDIIFIEDNCEGLFGKYEGMYSGSFPLTLCSSVSFYGNKTITTGEGGAFFTNDIDIYKYIKTYYSHGMSDIRYVHSVIGTNYRMTNIQAAFLYDQLNDIQTILKEKDRVYSTYINLVKELGDKVILLKTKENTEHSKWMFSILLKDIDYSNLESFLLEKNIQIRPLFYDIRVHNELKDICVKDEPLKCIENGCMLPSYPSLTENQQKYIINCIKEYIQLYESKVNNIEIIETKDPEKINDFLKNKELISNHFRYYDKRNPVEAIKNHYYTILLKVNSKFVGYAHVDYEDKIWIGICVLNGEYRKGYGSLLMKKILEFIDNNDMISYLTVDADNTPAIHLYLKNGFIIIKNENSILYMSRPNKSSKNI